MGGLILSFEEIYNLDFEYTNEGEGSIGRDFIRPCLKACSVYRRHTAFFRITALNFWSSAFTHLIKDNVKIELMTSMVVDDPNVIRALKLNKTEQDRKYILSKCAQTIIFDAISFDQDEAKLNKRQKLLHYLLANEQLEIKFALPRSVSDNSPKDALYHVKRGYFKFDDPKKTVVAFSGSFNESKGGNDVQWEDVSVFRSYDNGDKKRLERIVENCDREWLGESNHLEVFGLSPKTLKLLKSKAPKKRPLINDLEDEEKIETEVSPIDSLDIWKHKKAAIKEFLRTKRGILEMATGTGKTKTALEIAKQLINMNEIDSVICTTNGTDLLYQWQEEFFKWQSENTDNAIHKLILKRHFERFHEIQDYVNDSSNRFIITSRNVKNLETIFANLSDERKIRTLIIHDEIHKLGSNTLKDSLPGGHSKFVYRLGLSATPEREYDSDGNDFIQKEIGETIYKFSLEDAIKAKVLCPFNYYPIAYSLTEDEKLEKRNLIGGYNARKGSAKPMSEKELYRLLSNINKLASKKPSIFYNFVKEKKELLRRSIIFVHQKAQGDLISNSIKDLVSDWSTYYEGKDESYLRDFSDGYINTLIACDRISEGIDISDLSTVVLIASDRARLTTIQRIGRCLRTDPRNPDKVANVVDLVLDLDSNDNDKEQEELLKSDNIRHDWLLELSKIRPEIK